jgi:hypothetical protein
VEDEFSLYKRGLKHLLKLLGQEHPNHGVALLYEARLLENIRSVRRHGKDETSSAVRMSIIDLLNQLALAETGLSFNELCDLPAHSPESRLLDQHPRKSGKRVASVELSTQEPPLTLPAKAGAKEGDERVSAGRETHGATKPPRYESPGSWLEVHGFQDNPFAFPGADQTPSEIRQELFVGPPGFDQHIKDLHGSAVLLASPGGGKTAGRLWLTAYLDERRQRKLSGQPTQDGAPYAPLVVTYDDFTQIEPLRRLSDHEQPLLTAIAKSIRHFVTECPDQFLTQPERVRDWWWSFLVNHTGGAYIDHLLEDKLQRDLWRNSDRRPPFQPGSSLVQILEVIQAQCNQLHLDRLFILVDGVDSTHAKPEELTAPLLNNALLSLSRVVWKFFLPDALERMVQQSQGCQSGRLRLVHIKWNHESLSELLRRRLEWASGRITDMAQLCTGDLVHGGVDAELIEMARCHKHIGAPRALLEIGDDLRRFMDTLFYNHGTQQLSLADWEQFKAQFG